MCEIVAKVEGNTHREFLNSISSFMFDINKDSEPELSKVEITAFDGYEIYQKINLLKQYQYGIKHFEQFIAMEVFFQRNTYLHEKMLKEMKTVFHNQKSSYTILSKRMLK